jgi:hypothetical protein
MKVKEAIFLSMLCMTVLTTVMTTSKSFATVNLGALDEEEDEDNNSGYDTFLDDGTNSAYSGFPAAEEKINGFEGGFPANDELGYTYGVDGVDGVDGATAGGSPNDEVNAARTPMQGVSESGEGEGSLPGDGKAAATGGNDNNKDETDSDSTAYKEFLGCLSDAETGDGSTTEQEVQDCNESSYGGEESNQHTPIENTGNGNDKAGISESEPTDDEK